MKYKIYSNKLSGKVVIPPSKSIAHRAIICACLACEGARVDNIVMSEDIVATILAMKCLGAEINVNGDHLCVIRGINSIQNDIVIDCNESGSTLRFFIPIALAVCKGKVHFVGKGKLGERPLQPYYAIFDKQNINYDNQSLNNPQHLLDLTTEGNLVGGEYHIAGDISSQFISGLLFGLSLLCEDSTIIVDTPLQSKGYVDLTLQAMSDYGIKIINNDYQSFYIKGGQKYISKGDYYIEGDYSQSAFYEVANYIGSKVEMLGLNPNSLQGDRVIVEMMDKLSVADKNKVLVFDGADCPDIIPVFCIACALRQGKTIIKNVERLRIKECDRLEAIINIVRDLGGIADYYNNELIIDGVDSFVGGITADSYNDHRIAMLLAIAGTACNLPIEILNCECVKKSYPNFFEHFVALGGKII